MKYEDQEKSNQKELAALILLLLISGSALKLANQVWLAAAAKRIALQLKDFRQAAFDLNVKDQKHQLSKADQIIISAAATNLVATAARAVALETMKGAAYETAARSAVLSVQGKIAEVATTETFSGVNSGLVEKARLQKATYLQWNALLDKKTCSICSDNDGNRYRLGNEPALPAHPRCRCFWTIIL